MAASLPRPSASRGASRVTAAGRDAPRLQVVRVDAIRTTPQNPRSDADRGLDDLVASLSVESEPYLAQAPLVEQFGVDEFRIIAGERRVRAVTAAGWQTLACLVYPLLDAAEAHELRLVENLHRQALDALDEASALKIAWLSANADALGAGDAARAILAHEQAAAATLAQLSALLQTVAWTPTRPAVTWDQVLDKLGLDLSPAQRKRRMRLLSLDSQVQTQARDLKLSAAAMRAIGTLEPEQQQRLIKEMTDDSRLVRKVRRIASTVKKGTYTLDEALDEARGRVRLSTAASAPMGSQRNMSSDDHEGEVQGDLPEGDDDHAEVAGAGPEETDQVLIDAVMEVINLASQVTAAASALNTALNGRAIGSLGEPWGPYAEYAINLIREATQTLPA